jgi:hypothetical protein
MAGPLIYLGTHAIQEGKTAIAKDASRELGQFLEANHPRMIHFGIYIDDAAREMTVIQIHPDEESLLLHLKLAGEKIAQAYEFLEGTTKIEIYGTPGDALRQQVEQMAMGAPLRFNASSAGFSRLTQALL